MQFLSFSTHGYLITTTHRDGSGAHERIFVLRNMKKNYVIKKRPNESLARRTSGPAHVVSLLLQHDKDYESENDIPEPQICSWPEDLLQLIPDGMEVEGDQQHDEERYQYPQLEGSIHVYLLHLRNVKFLNRIFTHTKKESKHTPSIVDAC